MNFTEAFIEYTNNSSKYSSTIKHKSEYIRIAEYDGDRIVRNATISGKLIKGLDIHDLRFRNCVFDNVNFENQYFDGVYFEDCKFFSCVFQDVDLFQCDILKCEFGENDIMHVNILHCSLLSVTFNGDFLESCNIKHSVIGFVTFTKTTFEETNFKANLSYSEKGFSFLESTIRDCNFNDINLSEAIFDRCDLQKILLANCTITDSTFVDCNTNDKCFIDLQTILHSTLNESSLKLFGITNSYVKEYVKELTTELKFQSVFISYSFKDAAFARRINENMKHHGLSTFLWEYDAPGGKRLKKIMKEFIHKYDRVLFIASENSLKSEACQFELSEARTIQNREWKDIYYPIHIDDYIFRLDKEDIKPTEKREEYWKNIESILEFNSIDFTFFKNNFENNHDFDEKVQKVVFDLKV